MTTIKKSLAGLEDLLLGEGTVNQERGGSIYPISRISLIWPCLSELDLASIDTDLIKFACLKGELYHWSGSAWVKSYGKHFSISYSVANNVTETAELDVSAYKSATVKAYYTTTTAPISLMGYVFKNGSLYSVATAHNSGGYAGVGTLTLGAAGTKITIAKTAGSSVNAGTLTIELTEIVYA